MRAIILMAIGPKYEEILAANSHQFEAYAKRCNAQLEICNLPPDPSMRGHLFTQKLLLAQQYHQYEWIAFLDLDILISKNAPSIFDFIQVDKGFGAILDPRGERRFERANQRWHRQPALNQLSTQDCFINKGFSASKDLQGTINGGVWLCRPALVAELFSDYYRAITKSPEGFAMHEELPMAYLTQTQGLFFSLNEKFNRQVIYLISEDGAKLKYFIARLQKKINKRLQKFLPKYYPFFFPQYCQFINKSLENNYIIHFSGGFPIPPSLKNALRK